MVHRIVVEDQSLRWYGRPPKIADDSIEFVQLQFHLPEEWASLLIVAQFTQSETYNMLMPDDRCFLPVELKAGLCQVSLFGYSEGKPVRATSIPLVFQIEESGFVSSAETPIPPTPDLYAQLIEYFSSTAGSGGGGSGSGTIKPEDIAAAVEDYLSKNPPELPDLSDEVTRAETAASEAETASKNASASANNAGSYAANASNAAASAASFASAAEEAASDAEAAAARAEEAAKIMTDLDTTLSQAGKAADAKAVGDALSRLSGGKADFVVQDTPPEDTTVLWVDPTDNTTEVPENSGGKSVISYKNPAEVPLESGSQYIFYGSTGGTISVQVGSNENNKVDYQLSSGFDIVWILYVQTSEVQGSIIATSGTRRVINFEGDSSKMKISSTIPVWIVIKVG